MTVCVTASGRVQQPVQPTGRVTRRSASQVQVTNHAERRAVPHKPQEYTACPCGAVAPWPPSPTPHAPFVTIRHHTCKTETRAVLVAPCVHLSIPASHEWRVMVNRLSVGVNMSSIRGGGGLAEPLGAKLTPSGCTGRAAGLSEASSPSNGWARACFAACASRSSCRSASVG